MFNSIVIHYGEIGIKGKNRDFFEKKLIENLRFALKKLVKKVYRRYGRIICDLPKKPKYKKIEEILKNFPGIEYFAFSIKTELSLEKIKKVSLKLLKKQKFESFKVESKRSYKEFPLNSLELNKILGEYIIKKLKKKVDVKNPEIILFVEICEKESFLYTKKIKGIGGLPTSTSGKIISLLSGGIDSPVASFLLMKRGAQIIFVHFYNPNFNKPKDLKKIEKIVKKLTKFQLRSKLYLIPVEKIQKELVKKIPQAYRMILFRRFIIQIANQIAKKENAKALVTGDSLAQVASQTLENIYSIHSSSIFPILTPLIGLNKQEIIEIAKKIGTYEISIIPYKEVCPIISSSHPITKSKIEDVINLENKIDKKEKLIEDCLKRTKIKFFEI
ncbi:MAG: tRNA 4-thiouridine(8) synthase ThiI [Candidatus Aenigmarchaeota archaeon ex4484_224]|nr:MAG: tRNA 4-thiouridine(8) synthase ThiI [Candidatus Aenigmarchaeota archaeon ex4484_224]